MKVQKVLLVILTIAILGAGLGILVQIFKPEKIIGDTQNINVFKVYYHGCDISLNEEEKNELISMLKNYDAKRTLHDYFPCDPAAIEMEIGLNVNHKPEHIVLGEFNIWYQSADKGSFNILNAQKLQDELKLLIDSTSASKILTQSEIAKQFVKSQGYQIMMNSGANVDIQLPGSFDAILNGIQIGDFLKKRNEISKQNGLDFSSYLSKQVTFITYRIESEKNTAENINLIMDGNRVVGFWVNENDGEIPDFNLIQSAYQGGNVPQGS